VAAATNAIAVQTALVAAALGRNVSMCSFNMNSQLSGTYVGAHGGLGAVQDQCSSV